MMALPPATADLPGQSPSHPGRPRRRLWVLGIVGGVLGLLAITLLALQRPAFSTRLVNLALREIAPLPGMRLSVREVRGDWVTHLEVRGFEMSRGDALLIAADTLRARYHLWPLLVGRAEITDLDLNGVAVAADIAGPVDRARQEKKPKDEKPALSIDEVLHGRFYRGPALRVDRLSVRRVRYGGRAGDRHSGLRIEDGGLSARDVRLDRGFAFALDSLRLRCLPPGVESGADLVLAGNLSGGRLEVSALKVRTSTSEAWGGGTLAFHVQDSMAGIRLDLRAPAAALQDVSELLPGLDIEGNLAALVDLGGARLDQLSGSIHVDLAPSRFGDLHLGDSRLVAAFRDGRAETSMRTSIEEAAVEVQGWIRPLDASPTYDLTAHLDRLPRGLPGAPWWPGLSRRANAKVDLRVVGRGYAGAVFDVEGLATSSAGTIELDGHLDCSRGLEWEIRRLAFERLDLARLAGDTTASGFSGVIVAHGRGETPDSLQLSAALRLDPSHYGARELTAGAANVRLRGSQLGLNLRAEGNSGSVAVDTVTAELRGASRFRVEGARFLHLDLARLSGDPALTSDLNVTLTAQGQGLAHLVGRGDALAALRDGRVTATGQVHLQGSRIRDHVLERGQAKVLLDGGVVTLDGDVESDAGKLAVSASARPFATAPAVVVREARFADLDLGAWAGVSSLRTRLTGDLTVSGRRSPGGKGLLPDSLDAVLRLDSSRVGSLVVAGGEAWGRLGRGRLESAGSLRTQGGAATFAFDGGLGGRGTPGRQPSGHATLALPFGALAALLERDSLRTDGVVHLDGTFSGISPQSASASGTLTGHGQIDRAVVDSLLASFSLERGVVTLDTLALRSNVCQAGGSGRIALADSAPASADSAAAGRAQSDLKLTLSVLDLAPLKALLGADTLDLGGGSIEAGLAGPAAERTFQIRSTVRSLVWNDLRLRGAQGEVHGTIDRSWRIIAGQGKADMDWLDSPAVRVRTGSANAEYDGHAVRFDLNTHLDEQHRLQLAGTALADSSGRSLTLETGLLEVQSAVWKLVRPVRLVAGRDRFEMTDLEARGGNGLVAARGVLDRRGQVDLRLEMSDVGLDVLSPWLGRPEATGALSGTLVLVGPAAAPRGNGWFRVSMLTGGVPTGTLRSQLDWDGKRLDVDAAFTAPQGDSLALRGYLPVEFSLAAPDSGQPRGRPPVFEGDVDLRVAASRFPLRTLMPLMGSQAVGALDGTLDVDARLAGRSSALTGSGRLEVSDGTLGLPGLGVTYRDFRMQSEFLGDRFLLKELHVSSGEGELQIQGEVRLASLTAIEPDLSVNARRFSFVDSRDTRLVGSGSIRLKGRLNAPVVTGEASVAGSTYYLTRASVEGAKDKASIPLTTEDVRMMEETFGFVKEPRANPLKSVYDASDLDLKVTLERDNWLRQRESPELAVEVTGEVRVRKPPHREPDLFGRLEPVPGRGYVEQLGRTFDFTGGEVLLNGEMKDHTIDLRTEYKTQSRSESGEPDVVIRLDLQGRVDALRLTLSSEPPLSESEIVSYLATGRSPTDLQTSSTEKGSTGSMAAGIGLSQVAGPLEDITQEKIGLDVFQVRFDALDGATLVSGRYVDPDVYVGIRQPLQYKESTADSSADPNRTSVELEYEAYRWLVLNLQGEGSLFRSFLRARGAY